MPPATLDTAVVMVIFNRPHTTQRVFEAIRAARPNRLFIVADGPRPDVPTDAARCQETRVILDQVDWPCEVAYDFADRNLGLFQRMSSGLDWVFEQVEEAIVFEDDCLPDPSFFPFCQEVLARFRDDRRVMHINGNTYNADQTGLQNHSYGFVRIPHVWGWATWRRAWELFDRELAAWPWYRTTRQLRSLPIDPIYRSILVQRFDQAHFEKRNIWEYGWQFSVVSQNGLVVLPRHNLVSNIGFDASATHTTNLQDRNANLPVKSMEFPLTHPVLVAPDWRLEQLFVSRMILSRPVSRVKRLVRLAIDANLRRAI